MKVSAHKFSFTALVASFCLGLCVAGLYYGNVIQTVDVLLDNVVLLDSLRTELSTIREELDKIENK